MSSPSLPASKLIVLVDDVRSFRDGRPCHVARSSAAAVTLLHGLRDRPIDQLWLDHDLTGDDDIWPVIRLLEDAHLTGARFDIGVINVHASRSGAAHQMLISLRRAGYLALRNIDRRVWTTTSGGAGENDEARRPVDETGWEAYHRQMFDLSKVTNAFHRWKVNSTGVNMARTRRGIRNRARAAWIAEHGTLTAGWPLAHPPVVLWVPDVADPACLGCDWLGPGSFDPNLTGNHARHHATAHLPEGAARPVLLDAPLRVWRRDDPWDDPGPDWAHPLGAGPGRHEPPAIVEGVAEDAHPGSSPVVQERPDPDGTA